MAKKKAEEEKVEEVKKVEEEILNVNEIKEELTDYMNNKIDKEVSLAVEKATKKLIKHKNVIIIKRDITIIILLIICLFLGYNLYNLSNINIDITKKTRGTNSASENTTNKIEETEEEENKVDLKSLTEKYGYLVNNIYVSEESDYLKDYYKGELSDELKLYMSLNNVSDEKIISEDNSVYLDAEDIKASYNNLFSDDGVKMKSFKYGSLSFHYLSSKSLFIADGKFKKQDSNISKQIIDIIEDEDELEIMTIEGLVKDNKLYNIVSNEEVKKYNASDELVKFEKYLTKVSYYFNKSNDDYKLSEIKI